MGFCNLFFCGFLYFIQYEEVGGGNLMVDFFSFFKVFGDIGCIYYFDNLSQFVVLIDILV